ncbi:MAG: CinA family nicotinamide mononucleotide deamidase-related protein [Archangium sp.]|nr:CinA family nicotinamide mononucleotide deamidase-related protein [Archangium sp.]
MRIETICTGDELLTGLTSDTNSRFFQEALLDRTGLTVRRGVVVGDDRADIIEALQQAVSRADVVLVSGGLGPTSDDLTAECAAAAAGVPLVQSDTALRHIEERFKARGIVLSENNRRQAQVPQGAEVVLNQEGSAPMFIQRFPAGALSTPLGMNGGCLVFFVPGVPREYRHLVGLHVVPRIAALKGSPEVRKLALLKTTGLPESHLDERVAPLAVKYPKVLFGFRTHPPENHLKLLATGASEADASALLEQVVNEARAVLGPTCFGRDAETLPGVVLARLEARKEFLALAESCTGGMIAEQLTASPGASKSFYGGAATYLDEAKTQWLGVPEGLIAQFGAVSSECAEAMAKNVREHTGVQWSLSTTGWAGPSGGDAENPVGTVYIGIAGPDGVKVVKHRFHGDRERVRSFASTTALDLLRKRLEGESS